MASNSHHVPLKELYSHSMRHPANWEEWRKTLTVFSIAVGGDKEMVAEAHKEARREADMPSAVDELTEALQQADKYVAELPLEGDS